MNIRAVRREKVRAGKQEIECMLLTCTYSGLEVNTWMDEDGKVIRQETPLGWVLEAAEPSEAVAFEGNAVHAAQLLKLLAQTPALPPSSTIKEETP